MYRTVSYLSITEHLACIDLISFTHNVDIHKRIWNIEEIQAGGGVVCPSLFRCLIGPLDKRYTYIYIHFGGGWVSLQ